MTRRDHWNQVYQTKGPGDLSWYQRRPVVSLDLITQARLPIDTGIIDVGGGASSLVDSLIEAGYRGLGVLDVSEVVLNQTRARLGEKAIQVEWFEADITSFTPPHQFGLWHDRAVFHFLTQPSDRRGYVTTLRRTLKPGGTAIVATFALDGPLKCSGLDVMRHDEQSIAAELGSEFQLHEVRKETHLTPWQSEQRFIYCRFTRNS